jgi:hypothetical protein
MTHNIDSITFLEKRIALLENRIQSLLKYTSRSKEIPVKKETVKKEFTNAFEPHIVSHFIYKMKCEPTRLLIQREIKALWNQLSKEEQSYWKS